MGEAQKKTFVQAMKDYFGMSASDLVKELKPLTPDERKWYHGELGKVGIDCLAPGVSA